jgi:hypothetical protein
MTREEAIAAATTTYDAALAAYDAIYDAALRATLAACDAYDAELDRIDEEYPQ